MSFLPSSGSQASSIYSSTTSFYSSTASIYSSTASMYSPSEGTVYSSRSSINSYGAQESNNCHTEHFWNSKLKRENAEESNVLSQHLSHRPAFQGENMMFEVRTNNGCRNMSNNLSHRPGFGQRFT